MRTGSWWRSGISRCHPEPSESLFGTTVRNTRTARHRWRAVRVKQVVDRPLSIRKRAEVLAPPFFDLPLSREVSIDFLSLLRSNCDAILSRCCLLLRHNDLGDKVVAAPRGQHLSKL